jgi:dGTPase
MQLKEIKEIEDQLLARYAMKSSESRGRVYKEKEHAYRSIYQRDRDRVIHCAAFRRLEYKTQVFVNHEGDYYRTRLTHTLEVGQIARTIANALSLNLDLVEAVSLAHDLGHTPFGHSGEDALAELMKNHGGFNHNLQSLRVVDILEERYPEFPGLNLSWETREGIVKHSTKFDFKAVVNDLAPDKLPTLETQVVDVADEIAYDNHDLDDGLTSGLINENELNKIPIWNKIKHQIAKKYNNLKPDIFKYQIIRSLIDLQVTDIIDESLKNLKEINPQSSQSVRDLPLKIIAFSKNMLEERTPLRDFLLKNLYNHYRVRRMANKAKRFIKELFEVYLDRPEQLPPSDQERIKMEEPRRVICDYIAGMTDRYALDEYKKLFDPYEKV